MIMNINICNKVSKCGVVFKEIIPLRTFFINGLQRMSRIRTLVLLHDILLE